MRVVMRAGFKPRVGLARVELSSLVGRRISGPRVIPVVVRVIVQVTSCARDGGRWYRADLGVCQAVRSRRSRTRPLAGRQLLPAGPSSSRSALASPMAARSPSAIAWVTCFSPPVQSPAAKTNGIEVAPVSSVRT